MTATAKGGPPAGTRALPPPPGQEPDGQTDMLPSMPQSDGIDGMLQFGSTAAAEKRSTLFSIDGTPFTVLDNPSAALGLRYLDIVRRQGPMAAVPWALEAMLGPDGFTALKECEGLPPAGLLRVTEVCIEKLGAATDVPKEG